VSIVTIVAETLVETENGRRSRMIARIWRGATASKDRPEYIRYLRDTGIKAYRDTPGNQGAWIFWRENGEVTEFLTVSLWDSRESIAGFAGADIDRAVFYPENDRYLVERDLTVSHYQVETA
jgi:heme-degrading monooxygenase HmoA